MSHVASDHKPTSETTPDVLFPGHDGLRPPKSDALVGVTLELFDGGHPPVSMTFDRDTVNWTSTPDPDVAYPVGSAGYEAIELPSGLIGAQIDHLVSGTSSFAVFDLDGSRAIVNRTRILSGTTKVAERTDVIQYGIGRALKDRFPATDELVGKRIEWRYSDSHLFEHLYLEPNLYAWHGIRGPEAGMGSAEPSVTHKLGDGLYLFSWSEQAIVFNGALVIDVGDTITSAGRLLQWDIDAEETRTIIVGAHGRLLNETVHG
jgi:hypothetical protein